MYSDMITFQETEQVMKEMFGPSTLEQWYKWRYPSDDQRKRNAVKCELETILYNYPVSDGFDELWFLQDVMINMMGYFQEHSTTLTDDELTTVRNTLKRSNINCDNDYICSTWSLVYRKYFLKNILQKVPYYMKGFYLYKQRIDVQVGKKRK